MSKLLEVRNLSVDFPLGSGYFSAVGGVDLSIGSGEILSIVGESGSGKSVFMLALMGLLPPTALVSSDLMSFRGIDLSDRSKSRGVIGKDIAMIFQEPFASLNPCFTVGYQICEVLRYHMGMGRKESLERSYDLLESVGVTDSRRRLSSYPHELSGGICQRVGIAMALACEPSLLIADEPTTALDVSIQAQILDLLLDLQSSRDMALILITHDMGVVSQVAERVMVFYSGCLVESQLKLDLLSFPRHPYTKALLDVLPEHYGNRRDGVGISTIDGGVGGHFSDITGCLFHPRCGSAGARCRVERPLFLPISGSGDIGLACHYPLIED